MDYMTVKEASDKGKLSEQTGPGNMQTASHSAHNKVKNIMSVCTTDILIEHGINLLVGRYQIST